MSSRITNSNKNTVQTQDDSSSITRSIAVSELTLSHLSEINDNEILITSIKKGFKTEKKIPLKLHHPDNHGHVLLSYKGPKFTNCFPPQSTFKINEILLKKAASTSDESSLGDIHDGCWDILHLSTKQQNDCNYLLNKAVKEKYTVILTIVLEIIDINNSSKQLALYLHGINGTPLHRAVVEKDTKIIQTLLEYKLDINAQDKAGWTPLLVAVDSEIPNVVDLLITNGADVNIQNNQNQTPLHYAAERNNEKILMSLLQNQVKLNERDDNGQTPLFYAVAAKNLNVVDILLKKGADYELIDFFDYTPFHLAAQLQSLDVIEVFLKNNIDANLSNLRRQTPLFYSSRKLLNPQPKFFYKETCPKVIHALLKKGANINFQDSQGHTPLHYAVISDNIEFAQTLLEFNADVTIQDKLGKNVLHLACQYSNNQCTSVLLNFNIDINAVDIEKRTALHMAVKAQNYSAVQLILKKNPNINMKDKFNKTALHLSIESECLPIIELLLKNQANVNITDTLGRTALHIASINPNIKTKIIEFILNSTYDINLKDNDGRTAAHLAALNHNFRTLEYLLEQNANVNAKNFHEKTPLHLAMNREKKYRACFKCVKVLLHYKADINAVDDNLTSPLHLACFIKNAEVVKYLIENGANSNIPDKLGNTVFHYVGKLELNGETLWIDNIKKHTENTLNILVKENISVNCVNKSGKTPLHHAVEDGFSFINELFLNIGADVNSVDSDNNTAFDNLVERINYCTTYNSTNELIKLYIEHIVKMKVIKSGIRKTSLEKIYTMKNEENLKWIQSYELACDEELNLMKITHFDHSCLTYYVFFKRKPHDGVNFALNQSLVKSVQSNKLKHMFPIYAHFLKCHLHEIQQRRYLYEKIQECLKLYIFKKLPTCCMYEIFSYLNHSELDMFLKAMKPGFLEK
ncbi:alpha-latroinsectotoxin-Lt1a-like [Chelonus insularis]|uniref:alpha-latroinsectotoxin-Lt1a-like n=1 Tax=Chelonus insularis TaxID=460826 RepID=UPI00158C2DEF|nr:alpha-latroinsectotoxin-Lt1a-like [Chelonus insularis]